MNYELGMWLIGGLALMWFVQLGLAYWQMRRFYKRINALRKQAKYVSIGLEGSAWRGRQYAVLAVNDTGHIVRAEQLSGWTVLAGLRPIEGLAGYNLHAVLDDEVTLPVKPKLRAALKNAAQHILNAQKPPEPEPDEAATAPA